MKKGKNVLKRIGYSFMAVVLLFSSMPITTVRADERAFSLEERQLEEDSNIKKEKTILPVLDDEDKNQDEISLFDEDDDLNNEGAVEPKSEIPSTPSGDEPSKSPSVSPSVESSKSPSVSPSDELSKSPSDEPSKSPSDEPSVSPSDEPSTSQNETPSVSKTEEPVAPMSNVPTTPPVYPDPPKPYKFNYTVTNKSLVMDSGKRAMHYTFDVSIADGSNAEDKLDISIRQAGDGMILASSSIKTGEKKCSIEINVFNTEKKNLELLYTDKNGKDQTIGEILEVSVPQGFVMLDGETVDISLQSKESQNKWASEDIEYTFKLNSSNNFNDNVKLEVSFVAENKSMPIIKKRQKISLGSSEKIKSFIKTYFFDLTYKYTYSYEYVDINGETHIMKSEPEEFKVEKKTSSYIDVSTDNPMSLNLRVKGIESKNGKYYFTLDGEIKNNNEYNTERDIYVNYYKTPKEKNDTDHAIIEPGKTVSNEFTVEYSGNGPFMIYADVTGHKIVETDESEMKDNEEKEASITYQKELYPYTLVEGKEKIKLTVSDSDLFEEKGKRYIEVTYKAEYSGKVSMDTDLYVYKYEKEKVDNDFYVDNNMYKESVGKFTPTQNTIEFKVKYYESCSSVVSCCMKGIDEKANVTYIKSNSLEKKVLIPSKYLLDKNAQVSIKLENAKLAVVDGKKAAKYTFSIKAKNIDKTKDNPFNKDLFSVPEPYLEIVEVNSDGVEIPLDKEFYSIDPKDDGKYEVTLLKDETTYRISARVDGSKKQENSYTDDGLRSDYLQDGNNLVLVFPTKYMLSSSAAFGIDINEELTEYSTDFRTEKCTFNFNVKDDGYAKNEEFYKVFNQGKVLNVSFPVYKSENEEEKEYIKDSDICTSKCIISSLISQTNIDKYNEFTYSISEKGNFKIYSTFDYCVIDENDNDNILWTLVKNSSNNKNIKFDLKTDVKGNNDYCFSDNEKISISKSNIPDEISNDGNKLTRTYIVTLTGYTINNNIDPITKSNVPLTINISSSNDETKEVINGSTVEFTGNGSKEIRITYSATGNYTLKTKAEGYKLENGATASGSNSSVTQDSVEKTKQEIKYNIYALDKNGNNPKLLKSGEKIAYGQKIFVEDVSNIGTTGKIYPGSLSIEENDTKILEADGSGNNIYRVVKMNSKGTTSITLTKAETVFCESVQATQPFVLNVDKATIKKSLSVENKKDKYVVGEEFKINTAFGLSTSDKNSEYCGDLFADDKEKDKLFSMVLVIKKPNDEVHRIDLDSQNITLRLVLGTLRSILDIIEVPFITGDYTFELEVKYEVAGGKGYECPYTFTDVSDKINVESKDASLTATFESGLFYKEAYDQTKDITIGISNDEAKQYAQNKQDRVVYTAIITNPSDGPKVAVFADGSVTKENIAYGTEKLPIKIVGVGQAKVEISAIDKGKVYNFNPCEVNVIVKDSGLDPKDYIILYGDEEVNLGDFNGKCNESNGWVNKEIVVKPSDKQLTPDDRVYYDKVAYEVSGSTIEVDSYSIVGGSQIQDYTFWFINTISGAKAGGLVTFKVGVDTEIPLISGKWNGNNPFGPTSEGKQKYYNSDFVISGTVSDATSGVKKVLYRTEADGEWKGDNVELEKNGKYTITLGNGRYPMIQVKAVDNASNESEFFEVKENGEYVEVIVDATTPNIEVEAKIGDSNIDYNGTWTSNEIKMNINDATAVESDTIYADVYKFQYRYVSIADAMKYSEGIPEDSKDADSTKWKELPKDETLADNIRQLIIDKDGDKPDQNGCYYFRIISKTGVVSDIKMQRVMIQKTHPENAILDAGTAVPNENKWFNLSTGVPLLKFKYPEYTINDKEYSAPITVHVSLKCTNEKGEETIFNESHNSKIGIDSDVEFEAYLNDKTISYQDNIGQQSYNFEYNENTKTAKNGIYTLEYWVTDATGYEGEHVTETYKIDTMAPSVEGIIINNTDFKAQDGDPINYKEFFNQTVSGEVTAQYGVSGKGKLEISFAKKYSENEKSKFDSEKFNIEPNFRGMVYVKVIDGAGNETLVRTRGIVVDSAAPSGISNSDLIVQPSGSNNQGFYNGDIKVDISIKDLPGEDNCSSLKKVVINAGVDKKTVYTKELFNAKGTTLTEDEIIAASKFEIKEILNAKNLEGNDAYVEVIAEDMAGNKNTTTVPLKIDVTKPVISVSFDNMSARNAEYYKENRTATIHVTELNFDPAKVKINVTRDNKEYQMAPKAWTHNQNEHYATIAFTEDGDYTLSVECIDRADNTADVITVEPFTIDKTEPIVTVTYNNNNAYKENYYNAGRIATITVKEHNFDSRDFVLHMNQQVGLSGWTHRGDEHYATINFHEDGFYSFNYEFMDMAGTAISSVPNEEFYIDTTAPIVKIEGVENESANKGDIAPAVIVTDTNKDVKGIETSLRTGKGDKVNVDIKTEEIEGGYKYELTNLNSMDDNIYFLDVTGIDKAGNRTTVSYRYSLNRHGSTYDITSISRYVDKGYNRYLDIEDMEIVEMNVDLIDEVKIYISYNGEFIPNLEVRDRSGIEKDKICYSIKKTGNEKIGYTFEYIFYKENFELEGEYNIAIYSRDKAGNEVNSTLSDKFAKMHFVIDNTVPTVVIEGVENNKMYNQESLDINVIISDNFKLAEAELYTQDEMGRELARWNYLDLVSGEGMVATITIPGYDGMQTLLYRAKDAAGNEVISIMDEDVPLAFFVTTDLRLRFQNSFAMRFVTICIFLWSLLLVVVYIAWKHRKRKMEQKARK